MIKTRITIGLAALIMTLAMTATPALAEFESGSSANTGSTTITAPGVFTAGGVPVSCAAAGISATWTIQAAGNVESKQPATKRGPHQSLAVKWQTSAGDGKCTAELGGIKAGATVTPCNLQLAQVETKTTEVTGAVESECIVKAPGCLISVPKASPGKNQGLKSVKVKDLTKDLELTETNVIGVTANLTGSTCPEKGVISTATLTGFKGVALGEKLV